VVIRITNKCLMGCSHCMIDSKPDGSNMNDLVFEQCLGFVDRIKPKVLIISGGEPTMHPNIVEWVNKLKHPRRMIILASNGMFLEDGEMIEKIKGLCDSDFFMVQITNDKKYYPKKIKIVNLPGFVYIDKIEVMSNNGRAKQNKLNITRNSPMCFNLRSIARSGQVSDLKEAITLLESRHKFCQPSINYDGTISAGESSDCHIIGNMYDSNEDIFNNLRSMKCDNCNSLKNLSVLHRNCIE